MTAMFSENSTTEIGLVSYSPMSEVGNGSSATKPR